MSGSVSENLKAAVEAELAEVHELPQPIGLRILGAIERLTTVFTTELDAVKSELAATNKQVAELHDCVDRLEQRVVGMETRAIDRERAHSQQHLDIQSDVSSLRGEVRGLADVLGGAASAARTDAEKAADRAEAAERYLRDATLPTRSERPSQPAIPSSKHAATLPSGPPSFESGPPPPSNLDPVPE